MSHQPYNLFLDDLRSPLDAFEQEKHEMFSKKKWVVVRNYDEFVRHIHKYGLPQLVAFDHDLHETHYTPKEFWMDYQKSMEHQDKQIYSVETGLDCAKFLIDYCAEYNVPIPEYYSHSANTVGRDRISDILHYYKRYSGQTVQVYVETKTILKKVLMHAGTYVDAGLLFKGIYSTSHLHLREYDETIESIIEETRLRCENYVKTGQLVLTSYIENINQCRLVDVEVSIKL